MPRRDELLRELEAQLVDAEDDFLRFELARHDLRHLSGTDLPEAVEIVPMEDANLRVLALDGTLCRGDHTPTAAHLEMEWTPKLWEGPLGLLEYARLAKIAVEVREQDVGDVKLLDYEEDQDLVLLHVVGALQSERLDAALEEALALERVLLEVPEAVSAGLEVSITNAARRLADSGGVSLRALVDSMREGNSYEKGMRLEELTRRLFGQVPGFTASGRVSTTTEEIDFRITNNSDHPVWRRESALLLGECKNWSTNCGREVFSVFRDKLRGRTGRVSCGFLISWNGFTDTIEKQMLRGSEGNVLVVPIIGEDLRNAVRDDDFPQRLEALHEKAVLL